MPNKSVAREPWQIWCHGWNIYTKRRFDAGLPIIQRILAERQKSNRTLAQRSAESISKLVDEVRTEAYTADSPKASTDNQTGSIEGLAAAKSAQAGGAEHGAKQSSFRKKAIAFIGRIFACSIGKWFRF